MPTRAFIGFFGLVLFAAVNLTGTPDTDAAEAPGPGIITLTYARGAVTGPRVVKTRAEATVKVRQGDNLELRFASDRTATLHLHGYNIEIRLEAKGTASMKFRAYASGRFPIETHVHGKKGHEVLLYLEVHPR